MDVCRHGVVMGALAGLYGLASDLYAVLSIAFILASLWASSIKEF